MTTEATESTDTTAASSVVDRIPEGRHKETVAAAIQEYETAIGRPLVVEEAQDIERRIRERAIDAVVYEADTHPDWRTDRAYDIGGAEFGMNVPKELPAIWGSGREAFWSEGELAIIYGGDGTNKTTLAHNVLAGMIGMPGFETVLGQPVRRLQPGKKVLYLAYDRPIQIRRSWSRFFRPHFADHADEHIVWRTEPLPFDPVRHPLWVAEWMKDAYPECPYCIWDNVWDAFGDFGDTNVATNAGVALNGLARAGINPLALHHDRKPARPQKKAPENHHNMYGGRNFYGKAGSIVNLWKRASKDAVITVTQHKEPDTKIPQMKVYVNETDGTLLRLGAGSPMRAIMQASAAGSGAGSPVSSPPIIGLFRGASAGARISAEAEHGGYGRAAWPDSIPSTVTRRASFSMPLRTRFAA